MQLFTLNILAVAVAVTVGSALAGPDSDRMELVQSGTDLVENNWHIDKAHSFVGFRIRHLGISNVTGSFADYDATISMTGDDLSTFAASATINTSSVNTENTRRDDHLRSDDFFGADTYPSMTFESTGVREVNGDTFKIDGILTIRDISRNVTLDAERIGAAVGPDGSQRVGIEARTTIGRHDFGLTWNRLTEAGGVVAARNVSIVLDIQAIRADG